MKKMKLLLLSLNGRRGVFGLKKRKKKIIKLFYMIAL